MVTIDDVKQILTFLFTIAGYMFVINGIYRIIAFPIGIIIATLDRGTRQSSKLARIARIGAVSEAIIYVGIIAILTLSSFPDQSWFLFWESPVFLTIYLTFLLVMFQQFSQSYNPILRPLAGLSVASALFVAFLVVITSFFPSRFSTISPRWAAIAATGILLLLTFLAILVYPKRVRTFGALDERHDQLGSHLNELQHVGNILPRTAEWRSIQEAVDSLKLAYNQALIYLRQDNLSKADEVILTAEAEIQELNQLFDDRIRLSLKDELKAKLAQARQDCAQLRQEFEAAGFQGSDVDALDARLTELSTSIDELVFDQQRLASQVEPFEKLLADIVATRTALRFRGNVGASLDGLRHELRDTEPEIEIARTLGLDTVATTRLRDKLAHLIGEFSSLTGLSSAQDLVHRYRALRDAESDYRAALNSLSVECAARFVIDDAQGFETRIFSPKSVSTTTVATGAIFVRHPDASILGSLECELDGVSLDLQQSRSFSIPRNDTSAFSVKSFNLAGKQGGRIGRLKVVIKELGSNTGYERSFEVVVTATALETARDALVFCTPCGGVVGLICLFFWSQVSIAAPLGAGIGGVIGLLILMIQRLRAHARLKAYSVG